VQVPDASVVCGPREVDPEDKNTVTNPTLLVEVTSGSTEEYNRSEKFEHCRDIASLDEYVLVSHRERAIEVRRREPSGAWTVTIARAGDHAELRSIGCMIKWTRLTKPWWSRRPNDRRREPSNCAAQKGWKAFSSAPCAGGTEGRPPHRDQILGTRLCKRRSVSSIPLSMRVLHSGAGDPSCCCAAAPIPQANGCV
jgi:hypothetical protein